jgi:hypothetical protein
MPDAVRFPYIAVQNTRGTSSLRPLVPLTIGYRGKSVEAMGLLDTGSDVNVLPYKLGIDLGISWDDQKIAVSLGGNMSKSEARGIILTTKINGIEPVQLAFAWTRIDNIPLVLGQINFFAEFDVCFYRAQGSFEVRAFK